MGRFLLIQAKLPKRYCVRALSPVVHFRNLTVRDAGTRKGPGGQTFVEGQRQNFYSVKIERI